MLTLAFDSTAKIASCAISDGKKVLAEYDIDNGLTQSELLLPMAENMLKSLHLTFDDVKLLACSVGPGSFTGVRIGAAIVKGIAFGRDLPCVGVSTLEALARNLKGLDGIFVPVMDARRGQVYTALFSGEGEYVTRLTEDAASSLESLAKALSAYPEKPIYLVGDGYTVAKTELEKLGVKLCSTPTLLREENAGSVALLAEEKYEKGEGTSDKDLFPTYLRMPQAERERLERLKAENEQTLSNANKI